MSFKYDTTDTNTFISVVIAVKNEEKYIERCVQSVINQDFPKDLFQIVIVDGMSTDKTVKLVNKLIERYPDMIKLYQNPKIWQSSGRNIGIQNERTSNLIAYIDGHCIADSKWLITLYDTMKDLNGKIKVAGVGSVHKSPKDEYLTGIAIEQVFSTLIGGFGSSYIPAKNQKEVDTVGFVLYKRDVLEEVGYYDENMRYGEDFALNYKLRRAGYKLFVEPRALVYYYKRKTTSSFLKQMYNYGIAKAVIHKKYPYSLRFFHYIPSIFIISLVATGLVSVYMTEFRILFLSIISFYIIVILSSSLISTIRRKQFFLVGFMPILYVAEHLAYGTGFIIGSFKDW